MLSRPNKFILGAEKGRSRARRLATVLVLAESWFARPMPSLLSISFLAAEMSAPESGKVSMSSSI